MIKNRVEQIVVFFVFLSFFLGWFLASGSNMFFNEKAVMDQTPAVPSMQPIGIDLKMTVKGSQELLEGRTPYVINNYSYPPFTVLAFMPFVSMSHASGYFLISLLTMAGLFISLFLIDKAIVKDIYTPFLLLFFLVTSLFSYGLQFELERGQFNVIAITLAIFGISYFVRQNKILGLLLLTCAIQLKIYPAIFLILFFFADVKNKKNNILFLLTILGNFLLLFLLGPHMFHDFIRALLAQTNAPYIWIGNHSLLAYCSGAVQPAFCTKQSYPLFIAFYFFLIGTSLLVSLKKKLGSFNAYLFTLCGLGLLLIPSASHDYTLSLLPIIIYPLSKELYKQIVDEKKLKNIFFLGITIFLYTVSLFPPQYSLFSFPILANKAPILSMLIITSFFSLIYNVYSFRPKRLFLKAKKI